MKTCKRIAALLLALVLTCSLSVTALAAVEDTGFSDVDADDWFADSAVYVRDNGIMNGTSATTFDPNGTTSRGQIAAILYRAAGSPAVSGGTAFSDVAETAYYASAVRWASASGVVTGYADGTFRPNAPITRQQLAAILWRCAGSPARTTRTRAPSPPTPSRRWTGPGTPASSPAGTATGSTPAAGLPVPRRR